MAAVLDLLGAPAPNLLEWGNAASLAALRALEHPLLTALVGAAGPGPASAGAAVAEQLLLSQGPGSDPDPLVWARTEAQAAAVLVQDVEALGPLLERVARAAAEHPLAGLRAAFSGGASLPGGADLLGALAREPALALSARELLRRWWLLSGHPRLAGLLGLLMTEALSSAEGDAGGACGGGALRLYYPGTAAAGVARYALAKGSAGGAEELPRPLPWGGAAGGGCPGGAAWDHAVRATADGHTLESCAECSGMWRACADFPCLDFSLVRDLLLRAGSGDDRGGSGAGSSASRLADVLAWKLWPRHPRERSAAAAVMIPLASSAPVASGTSGVGGRSGAAPDRDEFRQAALLWLRELRRHEEHLGTLHARVLWPLALASGSRVLRPHGRFLMGHIVGISAGEEEVSVPALGAVLDLAELWPERSLKESLLECLAACVPETAGRLEELQRKDLLGRFSRGPQPTSSDSCRERPLQST